MAERKPEDYLSEPYKIHATPDLQTLAVGTPVNYTCGRLRRAAFTGEYVQPAFGLIVTYQWYIYYDNATVKQYGTPHVEKVEQLNYAWQEYKWKVPGHHSVVCVTDFGHELPDPTMQGKHSFLRQENIETVEALLAVKMVQYKGSELPYPYSYLSFTERYSATLKTASKYTEDYTEAKRKKAIHRDELGRPRLLPSAVPDYTPDLAMTPEQKRDHLKKVSELDEFAERLRYLIDAIGLCTQHFPIYAVHLETTTAQTSTLRLFLAQGPSSAHEQVWKLIDWTNPTHQFTSGVYTGKGATNEEAIKDAFLDWAGGDNRKGNRYPPGVIEYEVPEAVCGRPIKDSIQTTGATSGDKIANFFETVGLVTGVLALIAGVITAIAPVPGSQAASGFIWGAIYSTMAISAVAGVTAAGIRIGQRYDEGFSGGRDDVFDTLTIVANVLTLGQLGWAKGATLVFKAKNVKTPKWILIGLIASDGLQGIMIAQDEIGKYNEIMDDPGLSPEERTLKLLMLFKDLGTTSLLLYISIKSNARDMADLNAGKTRLNPEDFKIQGREITIEETFPVRSHTSEKGPHHTSVHDEQVPKTERGEPHPAQKVKGARPRPQFKKAKSPEARGMRGRDSDAFERLGKDQHIFVRDGNASSIEYIGKPGYEGKPEKLKAKTAKEGKHKGLAVADPKDAGLQQMLKEHEITYEQYVADLETKGFKVHANDDYLVTYADPASGNKGFYSDYDLHGVYDAQGNLVEATKVMKQMNDAAGQPVVRHTGHDEWPNRANTDPKEGAGVNYGPQPPVTVYGPDGAFSLESWAEMKAYAEAHNLRLEDRYRDIDWAEWQKRRAKAGKSTDL